MNVLLVPFVNYNDAGVKLDTPFIGIYILDLLHTSSIEPDEEGNTIIYNRQGGCTTLAVNILDFIKVLNENNLLNFAFAKEVDSIAPKVIPFLTKKEH